MLPMSEANTPNNPPLLTEDALNDAEKKVLKVFREGWEDGERQVIIPDGITEESIKAIVAKEPTAEDWQGTILRASFLRSLFLGSYDDFAPRLVTLSCARIEGELDLNYCESRFPLSFFWCIFPQGISLRAAAIPELELAKCLIGQPDQNFGLYAPQVKVTSYVDLSAQFRAFGEVNLNGANIGGQLVCNGGHFEKGLTAQNSNTGASVHLRCEFKSNDKVDLLGADIGGQLACAGGHFGKGLIAQSLKTGADVFLSEGFESKGQVILDGANIGGQLACAGGRFEEGLTAQNLKTGAAVLMNIEFESNGKVNLDGANIGGQLTCAGGTFGKGLTAQNLKTGESVLLLKGFKSNDKVILNGANIGGQFACAGGHFEKGLIAQNLKTGGVVFLSGGFKSNGKVVLSGADIGGQLDCDGGNFKMGLEARKLKTGGDVSLGAGINLDGTLREGFRSDGKVVLSGADIGGQLSCTGGHFNKGLIAGGLRYQSIDLGGDWEDVLTWLRRIQTRDADGGDFQYIIFGDSRDEFLNHLREMKQRSIRLHKIQARESEFQPYEQLMTVYRRMGNPDWARRIGFELEKKRHEQSPKGLWRAWYSILKWTIGYGYKPFQSLWLAISLPLIGAILFSVGTQNFSSKFLSTRSVPTFLANEWIPTEGEALIHWREKGRAPQDYPKFNPVIYSLESTFPVLPLGQLDKWHTNKPFFQWVRWGLTFTGSVLLAILALFGVGALRPTWKSEGDGS